MTLPTCGCRIEYQKTIENDKMIKLKMPSIVYCPLHAAATELLRCLKDCVSGGEQWHSGEARAIIAKAEAR